tara:strand:+ start:102 stop:1229 length:1128 start_codon:yes stop_codon:yes gene_type:complete
MSDNTKGEDLAFDDLSFDDMVQDGLEIDLKNSELAIDDAKEDKISTDSELDIDAKVKVDEEEESTEKEIEDTSDEDEESTEENEEGNDESEESEQGTVIGDVLKELGFETEESYDDTPEGIAKMTKDVSSKLAEEHLDDVMEQYPLIKQHMDYVLAGGDSRQFMIANDPNQDYGSVEVKENDITMQKVLVSNYFKSKGHDEEFIRDMVEDYADSGKLYDKSVAAKKALTTIQEASRQDMLTAQKEEYKQKESEQREFWDGVYKTVNDTDDLAGINIPSRNKKQFLKYISAPINKNGQTQSMLDQANAPLEQRLAMDYLMFNKFNLKEIVDTKVKTTKAKSLKNRLQTQQVKTKNASKPKRRTSDFDIDDLDLSLS